jgi:hypothetical protein
MPRITRPETIIDVDVDGWHVRKVCLTFKQNFVKEQNGDIRVVLTKSQTTQLINALKSQRKRKGVT